jgi:hypothetical protein
MLSMRHTASVTIATILFTKTLFPTVCTIQGTDLMRSARNMGNCTAPEVAGRDNALGSSTALRSISLSWLRTCRASLVK